MLIRGIPGLPLGRWLFALRTWLAVCMALGIAFWVQLDGAESAGVIACMIALQTRGQTFEKALCCLGGTVVGGLAAIVIVGLFAQTRDLYVLAYSAWLAACVFAAGFLDGNRAYGAVVCGYTVSIVAVIHIDDPGSLFTEIINRCAAIAIGIACITLVVDTFAGPAVGPALLDRVGAGRRKVQVFVEQLLRDGFGAETGMQTAAFLGAASNQHVLLNALPAEAVSGSARAGAIRATLAALAGEIAVARALATLQSGRAGAGVPRLHDAVVGCLSRELEARRNAASAALVAARSGRRLPGAPRMPVYRAWQGAARNALRAFLASVATGFLLSLTGWSETAFTWAMVGVVICLSSNAPSPAAMTKGALIGLPLAVLLGGLTKFVILDGADAFPLLMLGIVPAMFTALLAASSPNPALAGAGLLTAVYTIVVLSPSNPQSYDPQSYVLLAVLLLLVALFAFVLVRVLLPTTDAHRRRWVLASARRDMWAALRGTGPDRPDDEYLLLNASRISTLAGLAGRQPGDVDTTLRMADLAGVARCIRRRLARRRDAPDPSAGAALRALAAADADALRRMSASYLDMDADRLAPLAADMAWAACLIDGPAEWWAMAAVP